MTHVFKVLSLTVYGKVSSDNPERGSASGLQPTEAGPRDPTANRAPLDACSWPCLDSFTYAELQRISLICPSTEN